VTAVVALTGSRAGRHGADRRSGGGRRGSLAAALQKAVMAVVALTGGWAGMRCGDGRSGADRRSGGGRRGSLAAALQKVVTAAVAQTGSWVGSAWQRAGF